MRDHAEEVGAVCENALGKLHLCACALNHVMNTNEPLGNGSEIDRVRAIAVAKDHIAAARFVAHDAHKACCVAHGAALVFYCDTVIACDHSDEVPSIASEARARRNEQVALHNFHSMRMSELSDELSNDHIDDFDNGNEHGNEHGDEDDFINADEHGDDEVMILDVVRVVDVIDLVNDDDAECVQTGSIPM